MRTIQQIGWWSLLGMLWCGAVGAQGVEGELTWYQRIEVGVVESGVVSSIHTDVGGIQLAGRPLLSLDDGAEQAAVKAAEAALVMAKMAADEASREFERVDDLHQRTLISDHELELGKIAHQRATVARLQAEADLALAKQVLARRSIQLPFNSVVLKRMVDIGSHINSQLAQPAMLVVAHADLLSLRVAVTERQFRGLKRGGEVVVKVGKESIHAQIATLQHELDKATIRYWVTLLVPRNGGRPGTKATAEF